MQSLASRGTLPTKGALPAHSAPLVRRIKSLRQTTLRLQAASTSHPPWLWHMLKGDVFMT